MNVDHIFIELAVTHPNPRIGQIVGIAAVRTNYKGSVIATFSERVKCSVELSMSEKPFTNEYEIDASARSLFQVIDELKKEILNSNYESNYVVVGIGDVGKQYLNTFTHNTKCALFTSKAWIDLLALSWPLCYTDMISDRSLESICKHFKIYNTNPDTATGNCEALVKVYWALMKRYKTALGGEEILREVGGDHLEKVRNWLGF